MRKLNTPSYNILIPREKRIRAIQELYEAVTVVSGTAPQGEPPVSETESDYTADPPYLAYLPKDGANYHLGEVEGLTFSMDTPLMWAGCTIHFTAAADFGVLIPLEFTDTETGDVITPAYPAKIANGNTLSCEEGKEYIVTVVAVNGGSTGINVFSIIELEDSETE